MGVVLCVAAGFSPLSLYPLRSRLGGVYVCALPSPLYLSLTSPLYLFLTSPLSSSPCCGACLLYA